MSKSGFGQLYRRLSSKLLDLVVTPHVIGEVPGKSPAEEQELAEVNKKLPVMSCKTILAVMP